MKKIIVLFFCVLALVSYARYNNNSNDSKDRRGASFQDEIEKIQKDPALQPSGKKRWRDARAADMEEINEKCKQALPDATARAKAIQYLRDSIYGSNRCYHASDIAEYVPQADLKNFDTFVSKNVPTARASEIYNAQRRKIEDEMLENDDIQRKKDLEKQLHQEYKLFEDREKVTVTDIREKSYSGPYRKEITTEKLVKIGPYALSRFDLSMESRARIWQDDHDKFVKQEVKHRTRHNTYKADAKTEDVLDDKIQKMYLEAGYLPNILAPTQNIFDVEPKYWLTRRELVEAIIRKFRVEYVEGQLKARGYTKMDVGDGTEYVPREAVQAFNKWLNAVKVAKRNWDNKQKKDYENRND